MTTLAPGGGYCVKETDNSCPAENPVAPGSGAKLQVDTDIPATDSSQLTFKRTYNSGGYWRPLNATLGYQGGMFGFYWRSNFDKRIFAIPQPATASHALYDSDGRVRYFDASGNQIQPEPNKTALQLLTLGSPCPSGSGAACWSLRRADNSVEEFDALGRLIRISAGTTDHQPIVFAYDSNSRLSSATDVFGRAITFAYVGDRTLVSSVTDPSGNSWSYIYDDFGRLSKVGAPSTAQQRTYHYEDPTWWYALTGISDENGNRFSTYEYDSAGRVIDTVHAPDLAGGTINHRTYSYGTLPSGKLATTIVDPLGTSRTETFVRVAGALVLESTTQPCAGCGGLQNQSQTYGVSGFIATRTDFRGIETSFDHDSLGRQTERIDVANGTCPPSLPTCATFTRVVLNTWDGLHHVELEREVRDASNSTVQLARTVINSRGQPVARCTTDPANPTAASYVCGSAANAPTGVRQTRVAYCEAADIGVGSTCPIVGLRKNVDGPRTDVADVETFSYRSADDPDCSASRSKCTYRKGDLWKHTNAVGHVTEYVSYDKSGRLLRLKDANGVIHDREYHPRGWLTRQITRANQTGAATPGADAIVEFVHDEVGNITRITQPDGAFLNYTYDEANRLVMIEDASGAYIEFILDAAGNRKIEKTFDENDILRRRLAREFDVLGRLKRERDALSSLGATLTAPDIDDSTKGRLVNEHDYDGNSNRVQTVDGLGHDTDQMFDPLNRLAQTLDAFRPSCPIGDTDCGKTEYHYDARDNLVTVVDPKGLETMYTFDGLNDLTSLDSPDTGFTQYGHDSAGNRTSQTDSRGVLATTQYDALNRAISTTYPTSALNLSYFYDSLNAECLASESFPIGRLTRMTDETGETRYCYDNRGNVTRKTQVTAGQTLVTRYFYNLSDRLTGINYPSYQQIDISLDVNGRPVALQYFFNDGISTGLSTPVIDNIEYLPMGPVKEILYSNADTMARNYDANYAIDNIVSSNTGGLKLDLSVDVVGNVTGMTDVIGGPMKNRFNYDELDRLTEIRDQTTALIESFSYDGAGNRLTRSLGSGLPTQYTYSPDSHHLLSVGSDVRAYDLAGNTTSMPLASGAWTATYDDRSRLKRLRKGTTSFTDVESFYTGKGERVRKAVNGTTDTIFIYDEVGRLLGEYDSAGLARTEYIWIYELPVALLSSVGGVELAYLHSDHLAAPRVAISPNGNAPLWKWENLDNAFGSSPAVQTIPCAPPSVCAFRQLVGLRFPGQFRDEETGIDYNYFRDYDSSVGRYLQSDPIGLYGEISTYAYAGSRPVSEVDSLGLLSSKPRTVISCTAGAFYGLLGGFSGGNSGGASGSSSCLTETNCERKCGCKHQVRIARCMARPHCGLNSKRKAELCVENCSAGPYKDDPSDEEPDFSAPN